VVGAVEVEGGGEDAVDDCAVLPGSFVVGALSTHVQLV
jgi:hypothetical protein